ncbi:transglycosylase domain-containing protein [Qipengyuania sediminis]|uniref:transglycosylase domain-containing protein n=1 Tax=Qipengyuania sediminis TaxID=1532023 RepID=UPI00105AA04A|nr:transglycosylase domain-containing protein [Qipengyuania sediminis]
MSLFRSRREEELPQHRGYYSLDDRFDAPAWDEWDAKLERVERGVAATERRREPWFTRAFWRGRGWGWWVVRGIAAALMLFFVLLAWLALTAPLSKSLQPIVPPEITLTAADGSPIARNGAIVDAPVEIRKLPPHVKEAFLAIEDRRFETHWGIDPRGMARAAWTGYGGGSTITQQLAKFTFLTPEQTLTRKAREALIAFWLEAWLTKDQILERYLSNAYFGDNVYGLRAASLHYFYRQPERLTLAQAAMLAGLVQAPNRLNPSRHFARAEKRMRLVLGAMAEVGYIDRGETAIRAPRLDMREKRALPTGTYFADWALPEARALAQGGYARQTIATTLDSRLQEIARTVTRRAPLGGAQVALVAMRKNGEVVAMIGGTDYGKTPFNRATQARRQPGSTFKAIVYLAALRDGWSPDDTISNREIVAGTYRPRNAKGRYSDSMTLAEAFATSSNVAAVRLLQELGSDKVIATARALGITSPLPEGDPSLALGTSTMTLLELTSAYAGIAANALPVKAHGVPRGEAGFWEKLWDGPTRLSRREHEDMEALLRRAINAGTGRAAMLPVANFGKTGTTQDSRDALFVGYAGDLVVGVWVGRDDNTPLGGRMSGGTVPARIWRDFMTRALGLQGAASPRPVPSPTETAPGEVILGPEGAVLTLPGGEVRIDENGVAIEGPDYEAARQRIEEAREAADERYQQARERLEELEAEPPPQ